jgi:hypothetical protein
MIKHQTKHNTIIHTQPHLQSYFRFVIYKNLYLKFISNYLFKMSNINQYIGKQPKHIKLLSLAKKQGCLWVKNFLNHKSNKQQICYSYKNTRWNLLSMIIYLNNSHFIYIYWKT